MAKKNSSANIKIDGADKLMDKCKSEKSSGCSSGCGGAAYGLGFIGSAIYYISTATGFWVGVLGFLKAIVWPVFLVYETLKYVGA